MPPEVVRSLPIRWHGPALGNLTQKTPAFQFSCEIRRQIEVVIAPVAEHLLLIVIAQPEGRWRQLAFGQRSSRLAGVHPGTPAARFVNPVNTG